MDIGKRLKFYRNEKGLTQSKLAEMADLERSNISKIETGRVKPEFETIIKLCDALDITPNDLLMYEYNAPLELLNDDLAKVMADCTPSDYRKIVDYIHFIKHK